MSLRRSLYCAIACVLVAIGCATSATDGSDGSDGTSSNDDTSGTPARDFAAHPAVLEIDDANEIFALSDVHGAYVSLLTLLTKNHLIDGANDDPSKVKWTGGTATLIIVGDLIDKGNKSIQVIDLARSLQTQAPHTGGRLIAMLGNHEAEFLADPKNQKAMSTGQDQDGIDEELAALGIDPKKMATGTDPEGRGKWLLGLPLGVRIKKWFFAHGGNTQQLSIKDLSSKLEDSIAHHGYGDKDITGDGSILEDQQWYGDPSDNNAGKKEVDALNNGVEHLVFGHDPGALNDSGKIRQSKSGYLVKLDVAMGLHDGHQPNPGAMLHVTTQGHDTFEVLGEDGTSSALKTP